MEHLCWTRSTQYCSWTIFLTYYLIQEPVAVVISSQGLHTPIKRARQKSPDRKQLGPPADPQQLQPDAETREVLLNLQTSTSDIAVSIVVLIFYSHL